MSLFKKIKPTFKKSEKSSNKNQKDSVNEEIVIRQVSQKQLDQVLLEAKASEHSARMVAMKNATDAAGDLIEDLTLTYNQARQEAITKELLDIVTAQRAFQ